jgi:hypothetical protein
MDISTIENTFKSLKTTNYYEWTKTVFYKFSKNKERNCIFNSSNKKWVMHDDTGFMIDRNIADSEIRSNAHKWSLQDSSRSDLENWLLGEQQWILENIDSVRFSCIICDKFVYLGDVAHIHNSFNKKQYYWEYCFNCATLENNK